MRDGTVYKADTIIDTVVEDDDCGTIKTSVCQKNDKGVASTHVNFAYERCCNDEEGISPIGIIKLEPSTCSERICKYSNMSLQSKWTLSQVIPGCNCCDIDGELVSNGFNITIDGEEYECCDGKFVKIVTVEENNEPIISTPTTTATTITIKTTTEKKTTELTTEATTTNELTTESAFVPTTPYSSSSSSSTSSSSSSSTPKKCVKKAGHFSNIQK